MVRTLLAALMSAALAFSLAAGPAAAHETGFDHRHDRAGNAGAAIAVLGGLAALYLIKERSDRKEEKKREKAEAKEARKGRNDHVRGYERPEHRGRGPAWCDDDRDDRRPRWDDAYDRVLPDDCYRTYSTREGLVSGYGARCLQRSVPRPALLPPDCISQIRTDGGIRNLYADRCLRRAGWTSRTARR